MDELTPKLINLKDSGLDGNGNFIIGQPSVPSVLRDKMGRVIWKLPGNTPEQNEQLGIRNIQALFLEKFPEFAELFPRGEDGKIAGNKREDAKDFILKKVGNAKSFDECFRGSPHNSQVASYFNSSFATVLRKSFHRWGLKFRITDFKGEKIGWKEKEIEEIDELIRTIFLEEYPEFGEKYLRGKNQIGDSDGLVEAKKFILDKLSKIDNFRKLFGIGYRSMHLSHIDLIKRAFSKWGVQFKLKDFDSQNLWKGKSEEELIRLARTLFYEQYPEVETILSKDLEKRKKELKDFILSKVGKNRKFRKVFPTTIFRTKVFGSSYREALCKIFEPWGVEFSDKDFIFKGAVMGFKKRMQKPSGYWKNQENIKIEAKKYYSEKESLSYTAMRADKKVSLIRAIERNFPGGFPAIKKELDIQDNSEPSVSPDEANRRLEEFFEEENE